MTAALTRASPNFGSLRTAACAQQTHPQGEGAVPELDHPDAADQLPKGA
jgi:hypothetical protein